MHVHFVCRGNLYRGRLAEAYLRSKQIPGLTVTSSGTEADQHKHYIGPISWEALRLIKNNNLVAFMKLLPEKTTGQALSQADIVIFFGKENYEAIQSGFPHLNVNSQIWEIPDIALANYRPSVTDDTKCMEISERTFIQIKQNVDELVEKILNSL
jgi:protein-tyrosine-phosphatase